MGSRVNDDAGTLHTFSHTILIPAPPPSHMNACRDLKPGNVLMSASGSAKISDFGLARCKYKTYLSTKKLDAGTVAYM